MGMVRSVEVKQSLKERQDLTLRGLCEGRKDRVLVPIVEAPGSVRGLTRVQDLPRLDEKGC